MVTLQAIPLFRHLNPAELQALRMIAQQQRFAAGQQIFLEGAPGDGVYFVKHGLVEISSGKGGHHVFSRLGPGEIFGEMAVIEDRPRSATASAAQDSEVYFLARDEMLSFIERSPGLAFALLQQISLRLREFNQFHLRELIQAENLAVIGRFARGIVHDLKNPLNIISLSSDMFDMPGVNPETRAKAHLRIRKQVERISDMVSDILIFTEGAKEDADLKPGDYRAFISELVDDLRAGEIQAPQLGVSAKAFNARGESVIDEVGELVLTEPMPSMPLRFWNDPEDRRYLETYFQEFPGIWRHGDFFRIDAQGRCCVLGRSDATLNRYGIRIGTAEIYRTLALLPQVQDALIVNLDLPAGGFFMPLFVKLAPGVELDAALEAKIRDTLRREYTPRHVPDKIYRVPGIPYTLTGKKMEVPVRRILMGVAPEKAANRSGVSDPGALDFFIAYAQRQQDYRL